jgi:gliding motility-associated-like protein
MINKSKNNFEDFLKSSLENYSADYNEADWISLEEKLNKTLPNKKWNTGKVIFTGIAATVIIAVVFWINNKPSGTSNNHIPANKNIHNDKSNSQTIENNSAEDNTSTKVAETASINLSDDSKTDNTKTHLEKAIVAGNEKSENNSANTYKNINVDAVNDKKENTTQPIQNSNSGTYTPVKQVRIFADKQNVCVNDIIKFSCEVPDCKKYLWDFGDDNFSNEKFPSHKYSNWGNYKVKLTAVSSDGKEYNSEYENLIAVNQLPTAEIVSNQNSSELYFVDFEAKSFDAVSFYWNLGDGTQKAENKFTHLFRHKGNYIIKLTSKNAMGCESTATKNIAINEDFNLQAPNAFSPNGDGKNDTWIPLSLQNGDYEFYLNIFDKSGKLVYSTKNKNQPWDGRNIETNEMVKSGESFVWIAIVKNINGKDSEFKGSIVVY